IDVSHAADGLGPDTMMTPEHMELRLKPISDPEPTKVVIPTLHIREIPGAMRRMGWPVSAALMERWFEAPAWTMPGAWKTPKGPPEPLAIPAAHVDTSIARMDWAISFSRCRNAIDLLREKMANPAALNLLRERLEKLDWGGRSSVEFGRLDMRAIQLDQECQANSESLGETYDTLDDMYGALGKATLKVALIGEAMRNAWTGRLALHVTHVGFYLRDNYDFNGFQFLGTWTHSGVLTKAQMVMNAMFDSMVFQWHGEAIGNVFNHDFDRYRQASGRGGDFVIYSDVRWEAADLWLDLG
ncbi:DUF6402 family protein, partial [Luteibacter sp.]|uniref:DUF6402 family protein n=1 Tax=Luteibacter sp. TaxID=1886636 RepID=UPI002F3FA223